ncbi:hypothetical protein IX84_29735 [Phaeodactylibacter xiamenensis]|uniref:PKD domain-containing protein n=1 Tax=Phaeodactylibacter xiamenensis TaxID=1524460 RepID=A0A098RY15_9BACT|nr:hypothetical protein IX84_29735 [Phaeodactylibacter xiamenensis]
MGYAGGDLSPDEDTFGLSILHFAEESLQISDNQEGEALFRGTNVSFSDSDASFFCSFDGTDLYNADHEVMEGGGDWFDGDFSAGWSYPQSGLILPFPEDPSRAALINTQTNRYEIGGQMIGVGENIYFSEIDQSAAEGLGAVVVRKELLLSDTVDIGKLSACRHANGRDWWIIMPEFDSNRFYRYLLTPSGISLEGIQEIGALVPSGVGQALFSPDGTKHLRYNGISSTVGDYVTIYDFDRCTGLLSNFRQRNHEKEGSGGGAVISKNSRYLYVMASVDLYQYDLWAEDIEATRTLVAEYDGHLDPFPTTFFLGQLAPDGKIYICSTNGVTSLHVIHNPDAGCPDCRIEQHGIELPTFNSFSIPNQPNYRLGPIDGSPCDTLGIDNIPLARWRYEQDTLEPFLVQFYDLSDYEPTEWLWDFDDGSTSTDTLPQHSFPGYGTYEVCLTVSNANGSGTQCKELEFTMPNSTAEEKQEVVAATAFPNPFRERFSLSLRPGWLPVDAWLEVYDAVGRQVHRQPLRAGVNSVELSGQPGGVYVWRVVQKGQVLGVGKIVKW